MINNIMFIIYSDEGWTMDVYTLNGLKQISDSTLEFAACVLSNEVVEDWVGIGVGFEMEFKNFYMYETNLSYEDVKEFIDSQVLKNTRLDVLRTLGKLTNMFDIAEVKKGEGDYPWD